MKELIQQIKEENLGKLLENVPMKKYTTYKVGGIAKIVVFPKDISSLVKIVKIIKSNNINYIVLGNGSNVIFSSKVYDGVIIKLDCLNSIKIIGNRVIAGSGASLMKTSMITAKKGLTGLEFASGIPGSIGGAVYMNAGAYKSDMGFVVTKIKVLTRDLKIITMVNSELNFHYRSSFLQKHKDYICLEATMQLKKGNKEEIEKLITERRKRRIESQPLEYPSAGSVFRNPDNDYAGRLIEELGYKGLIKGGAQVSEKHANFIINKDNATAEDVRDLIYFIKDSILEKYGIKLKVEQEFINWE